MKGYMLAAAGIGCAALLMFGTPFMGIGASILWWLRSPGCAPRGVELCPPPTPTGSLRVIATVTLSEDVMRLAWSPDGTRIVGELGYRESGLPRGEGYRVWEVATQRQVGELRGDYGGFFDALEFTPDGRHLIVQPRFPRAMDGERIAFALWNVETGAIEGAILGPSRPQRYVLSPGAERMAILYERDVVALYDTRTWERTLSWQKQGAPMMFGRTAFAFSGDGETIAVGVLTAEDPVTPRGRIELLDAATGAERGTILLQDAEVPQVLAFLGRTTSIVHAPRATGAPEHDAVRITGMDGARRPFSVPAAGPQTFFTSADGRYLTILTRGRFEVWDVPGQRSVGGLSPGSFFVDAVAMSPDGTRLAVAYSGYDDAEHGKKGRHELLILDGVGGKLTR